MCDATQPGKEAEFKPGLPNPEVETGGALGGGRETQGGRRAGRKGGNKEKKKGENNRKKRESKGKDGPKIHLLKLDDYSN